MTLTVAVVIGSNAKRIARPSALIEVFDPRPFNVFLVVAAKDMTCNVGAIAPLALVPGLVGKCAPKELSAFLFLQSEHAGLFGAIVTMVADAPDGTCASSKIDQKQEVGY